LITAHPQPLWSDASPERTELATRLLGFEPLDLIPIEAPAGRTVALAAVLPTAPTPNASRADRVYVKGMFVTDACTNLMPAWAFFVSCVAFSDGLRPTASREDLHEGEELRLTREELGDGLREALVRIGREDPDRLRRLIDVHHLSMKALAIDDPGFLRLVLDWLPIDTSVGRLSFGEFRRRFPVAVHASTVTEFQQLAPICSAQGIGLVNGGFTHDDELTRAASAALDDFDASPADLTALFAGFGAVDPEDAEWVEMLKDAATQRVESYGAALEVRRFEPAEVPALLAMDATANAIRRHRQTRERSGDLFAGISESLEIGMADTKPIYCLNSANPIVRSLAALNPDDDVIASTIDVLYLYATLTGHHPLGMVESAMLNTSLVDVIARAASASASPPDPEICDDGAPGDTEEGHSR
jgi:molecular chaperone HtpG